MVASISLMVLKYLADGRELLPDGREYLVDGRELLPDGREYLVDGREHGADGFSIFPKEKTIPGKGFSHLNIDLRHR